MKFFIFFWFHPNIEPTTNSNQNYNQLYFIFQIWNFSGLDYEYSGKGITIQCLCPGPVATDMVSGILKGRGNLKRYFHFVWLKFVTFKPA